jgi:hypothetical protein
MIRKIIVSCIATLGLVGCAARARVGPVHAGGGVSTDHRR